MIDEINTAPATPSPNESTPATQEAPGVSLLTTCAIAAIFSVFSGLISWHFAKASTEEFPKRPQLVLLDASKLADKKLTAALSDGDANPEKAAATGKAFIEDLDKVLAEYTSQGIPVLNSAVVVNKLGTMDITQAVADRLHIKLD